MDADTQIGGPNGRFPETRESAIARTSSAQPECRTIAYEAILSAYWKPVYRYIRIKWRKSNEDAKDLTQAFFTSVLTKELLPRYDPAKARFRTYLRTCLDGFLANQHKYEGRLKRSAECVPLEEDISGPETPDACFEREWTRGLFANALERLKETHPHFRIFERYDLSGERLTYEQLAREFGLTTENVTNYLASARRELRRMLLAQVRAVTPSEREFRSEARMLLGGR